MSAEKTEKTEKSSNSTEKLDEAYGTQVTRLGDYVFGRKCGQGQFGRVVMATHEPSGRTVAIKCVEKANIRKEAWRLVEREAYIMKIMHHPNIIRFVIMFFFFFLFVCVCVFHPFIS